ncbi:MAG: DUF3095 domain-containing protein [Hyphomicrobiales bacterium]
MSFYENITLRRDFDQLAGDGAYVPLPDDWVLGMSDIVGSTQHIAAGGYKAVNTVGAAVISAQINMAKELQFPYVFGGDGAAFAMPPEYKNEAEQTLANVVHWAGEEFAMQLRAAMVPIREIRAAGEDVKVARYQVSEDVDYAMFTGGGVAWADGQMKAGNFSVSNEGERGQPDLSGLSCRWSPMDAQNGKILSVLVLPAPGANKRNVEQIYQDVIALGDALEDGGHPASKNSLKFKWPSDGGDIEAHSMGQSIPLFLRKLFVLGFTLYGSIVMNTGLRIGGFDPAHYTDILRQNLDFRKFDDGLKMTIDCDEKNRASLEHLLEAAADNGIITYGISEQDQAIMTCIVPSFTRDDHIHFVDGAAGGYAFAASKLKGKSNHAT